MEKPSLHKYIEDNHKLLSSLGIFTALTIFARTSIGGYIGELLSVLFLTLSLLLWLELMGRLPSKMGTSRMYWLTTFRKVFSWITIILVFIAYSSLLSWIAKKYDLFNRLFKTEPGGKKVLRYILSILLIIIGIAVSFIVMLIASHYFDKFLDLVNIELVSNQLSP